MLRTPLSNARTDQLENLTPEQILGIFASFHQAGTRRDLHKELADAWGALCYVVLAHRSPVRDRKLSEAVK